MADPVFRAATSASDLSGSATTLALTNPAGLANGDGQIIWVSALTVSGGSPVFTAPSGWTQYGSTTTFDWAGGLYNCAVACFYRIANSDGTATVSMDRASYCNGMRLAYTQADQNNWASGITIVSTGTASGTSHVFNGITTTQNRQMTSWAMFSSAAGTWTPPGTVTERVDIGGSTSAAAGDAIEVAAGATGTRTFTSSSTGEGRGLVAVFNGRPDRFPARVTLQAANRAGTY